MMKKRLWIFLSALLLAGAILLCGCEPHYYKEESSAEPEADSVEDPTPDFVFGENGFYDTKNDREYLILAEYVLANEKGELYCSGNGRNYYRIVGESEEYLLCDEGMRVYCNTAMPFAFPWEDAEAVSRHPGLSFVQDDE